jgi:hypothetical protein
LAAYPEFTGTYNASPSSLANDFVGATFLLNNTCCSRVQDANQRMFLLYLLTAHIAAIHQGSNDGGVLNPAASFVGSVAGNTLSVSALSGGALAVGSVLYDGPSVGSSLLVAGTTITALGSGTGGIGTYTVNGGAQTVASESMIVAGVPNVVQPLGIVGRINNASEGDVSLTSEWSAPPSASQAYFIQTKYGADYWTYTAPYRTALFIRAPQDAYNPLAAYGLGPWGPGRGL